VSDGPKRREIRTLSPFATWPFLVKVFAGTTPTFGLMYMGALLLGMGPHPWLGWLSFGVGLLLSLAIFRRGTLTLAAEGIAIRWLGRNRVLRWSQIERVGRWSLPEEGSPVMGIEIVLRSGRRFPIPIAKDDLEGQISSVYHDARERLLSARREANGSERLMVLERGARDDVAWVRHLRALGSGAQADARTNHVGTEALLRVLEDDAQAPLARVSAAVAAASQLSPVEQDRVRIAACASLDDSFRVAIEAALDPQLEDQAVAELLSGLERVERDK
jgi:hypothetical protein